MTGAAEDTSPLLQLEALQAEVGAEGPAPEGGAIPPTGPGPEGAEAPGGEQIPPEAIANQVIEFANNFLASRGVSPLDDLQTFLLRVGLVGTIKKHDIRLDPEKYPEIVLLGATVWIAADKVKEYRKKAAQKAPPPPPAPADDAPMGAQA